MAKRHKKSHKKGSKRIGVCSHKCAGVKGGKRGRGACISKCMKK
jgi:hypothetical protein